MNVVDRTERYQQMKKIPLQIKINLVTPMVYPNYGIHLDSLLTEAVARELFSHDLDRWQDQDKHIDIPLPLERTEGKYPIWKASIGFISPLNKEHRDFWVKRTNDEFAGFKTNKIVWPAGVISDNVSKQLAYEVELEKPTGPANNPSSGGFKSYYEGRNLVVTDYIVFHAVGNKDEVYRLLNNLKGIGKKTGIGYGKIGKIEVIETEHDYSLLTPDEKPARQLPCIDFPNIRSQIIASRTSPPYWSKRDLVVCYNTSSSVPIWEWVLVGQLTTSLEDEWYEEDMNDDIEDDFFDD